MPFDYTESQLVWDGMIRDYGYLAILRMPGKSDRYCYAMDAGFMPAERLGRVSNPSDRHHLVSVISPDTGLPIEINESEMLITLQLDENGIPILDGNGKPLENEKLRQYAPPHSVGPHNLKHLYWILSVRQ